MKTNKSLMAENFNRAADSYDSVAHLQQQVGNGLWQYTQQFVNCNSVKNLLDLGCGTGLFTEKLGKNNSNLIGLDIAYCMAQKARQSSSINNVQFICGDAEILPFQKNSVDLIFSNLVLQWCHLENVFSEVHRVLQNKGFFCFSILGPETLFELKHAWKSIDNYDHVNEFDSIDAVFSIAQQYNFNKLFSYQEKRIMQYQSAFDLLKELKALGAQNVNEKRPQKLLGKSILTKISKAYDHYRDENDVLPATYDVSYIILRK